MFSKWKQNIKAKQSLCTSWNKQFSWLNYLEPVLNQNQSNKFYVPNCTKHWKNNKLDSANLYMHISNVTNCVCCVIIKFEKRNNVSTSFNVLYSQWMPLFVRFYFHYTLIFTYHLLVTKIAAANCIDVIYSIQFFKNFELNHFLVCKVGCTWIIFSTAHLYNYLYYYIFYTCCYYLCK